MARKDRRKTPPPTLAVKALTAAKKQAERFAKRSMGEVADTTFKSYRLTVQFAIEKAISAPGDIGGVVAEEAAWMELSPKVREARIAEKAAAILKRPPAQLPASVQPTTLAEARRQATRILKREAARQLQMSPKQHAELAKELLGLYRGQAHAALEYRADLIRSGMSPKDVAREFKKLVNKKLEYRARMIGEYENRRARFTLQRGRWMEQMERGTLKRTARKYVVIQSDACPICQRIRARQGPIPRAGAAPSRTIPVFTKAGKLRQYRIGRAVRKGKVWGQRWVPGPPFHINCRCYEKLFMGD